MSCTETTIMKKFYLLLVFFCTALSYAQNPADLDSGFNRAPIAINQFYNENNIVKIQAQSDGKLIILSNTLVRVDENGVDNTFNTAFELNSTLTDFSIQPDGKIVVVGNFHTYAGISREFIVRINADGSIDNTFIPAGNSFYVTSASVPKQVVALANGKMLVFGPLPSYNNVTINGIACLNTDGSLDTSFVNNYDFATANAKFFVQPDGKILALSNANSVPIITGYNDTIAMVLTTPRSYKVISARQKLSWQSPYRTMERSYLADVSIHILLRVQIIL